MKRGEDEPAQIAAKEVRDGDFIRGYSFTQKQDIYRRVSHIRHSPTTMWFRVQGYLVSPCEAVFVNGEWVEAYKAEGAEKVRGIPANRIEITVETDDYQERNYYLDDGTTAPLLIHNFTLPRS